MLGYHIANRNQPDDNGPDGSSLNPANAARQLGFIDEVETTNTEQREECRYATLNLRTVRVIPMNFSKYYCLLITTEKEQWIFNKIKIYRLIYHLGCS